MHAEHSWFHRADVPTREGPGVRGWPPEAIIRAIGARYAPFPIEVDCLKRFTALSIRFEHVNARYSSPSQRIVKIKGTAEVYVRRGKRRVNQPGPTRPLSPRTLKGTTPSRLDVH